MRLAVMQPYFLPYLGYFMLIRAVDRFVVFDDVQHIARGYVTRNSLLLSGRAHGFSVPVRKAGRDTLIRDVELAVDDSWRTKFLELARHAYAKAPCYARVRPLLEEMVSPGPTRLEPFLTRSLRLACDYLGLGAAFSLSSDTDLGPEARGREKIIPLCLHYGADTYVNASGGRTLYAPEPFAARGITLRFVRMEPVRYRQFGPDFVPGLSILDALMFNPAAECRALLDQHALVPASAFEEAAA